MSLQLNIGTPYGQIGNSIKTDRGVEFDALARVTRDLKEQCGSACVRFSKLCAAIHANRKLWNMLAADVATTDNQLPAETKARVFYLAEFVGVHSRGVLKKTESPEVLIDINLAIMRGLSSDEIAR